MKDEVVLSNAAQALVNIASDESSRREVMSEGGLEALIMICVHSDDERVLGYAAQALAELAAEREQRIVMAQQGAIAILPTHTPDSILTILHTPYSILHRCYSSSSGTAGDLDGQWYPGSCRPRHTQPLLLVAHR
jgi:hypothetical protein